MTNSERAMQAHYQWKGKIEVTPRAQVETQDDLAIAYTPGVAQPCLAIQEKPELAYELTRKGNLVAVITDGTAVLGLGDIGPQAAMPVMEGKCLLFKEFGGVDAIPLCVDSKDVDTLVETIRLISKSFGGINLEDIGAPRCFEVERRLKEVCDIPVFHDDQHGTAIVVGAALVNALKVAGKSMEEVRIVINGAGAAGTAIARHLLDMGCTDITMCDYKGIVAEDEDWITDSQRELAKITNRRKLHGLLGDAMKGADVFIGVSRPNLVTPQMVSAMAEKSILFAMANPVPEIMPEDAKAGGAFIVGTGRSDFPNQINNLSVFPGIFKGALSVRAKDITKSMMIRASYAIASSIPDGELSPENIIPSPLQRHVADLVAQAVADEAVRTGIARI